MKTNLKFKRPHPTAVESDNMARIRHAERMPQPEIFPSPDFGTWIAETGGSIAFSTYQSSRLFLIFAGDHGKVEAQERIVGSAMGLAINRHALWISNKERNRTPPVSAGAAD